MNHTPFDPIRHEAAIRRIDAYNAADPNREFADGKEQPKELLYSQRMTDRLAKFLPDASEALRLAARCQHIGRWHIARSDYPMNLRGYNNWRRNLRKFHATVAAEILTAAGYDAEMIGRVDFLIQKRDLKQNPDSQSLEDVVCLVFLEYYFDAFAEKHSEEKLIDILQKTWGKMSDKGREAAHQLPLSDRAFQLIAKALAP